MPDSLIASDTPLAGITVSGNNNNITLDGRLNIDFDDQSTSGQYLDVIGLNVTGDGNSVSIDGGIDIIDNGKGRTNGASYTIITGINVNGNNCVTLSGRSTLDTTSIQGGNVILAQVDNGGS